MGRISAKNIRRSSGIRKVSRKNRAGFKHGFGNSEVRQLWDPKRSAGKNYEKLGIAMDPNSTSNIISSRVSRLSEASELKYVSIVDGKCVIPEPVLNERNPKRPPYWISDDDIAYIKKLISIHGNNDPKNADEITDKQWKAMERDIETNYMQRSAQYLKTRGIRLSNFLAWKDENEKSSGDNVSADSKTDSKLVTSKK